MGLDNRELATIILTGAFVLWVAWFAAKNSDGRRSMRDIGGILLGPKLLVPLVSYVAWVAMLAVGAEQIGLWTAGLSFPLIAWFIAIGIPLVFRLTERKRDEAFFRPTVRRALGATAVVEALIGLTVFSLWFELLLGVTATVLFLLSAVAGTRDEFAPVKRLTDALLGSIGLGLVLAALLHLAGVWGSIDRIEYLRELALPIWLTVGVVPFLYILALYSCYEQAFMRIGFGKQSASEKRRARIGIALALHGRAGKVNAFAGSWPYRAAEAGSVRGAVKVGREFLRDLETRKQAERDQAARLERFAGVDGTDDLGRRLDQREFNETREALRQLATAQMGWYRNDGRYRDDLHTLFPFSSLPEDHGACMEVSKDGQAWFAWRRTVTGWCFAVGASGPPPSEYTFEGADPPPGFPGRGSSWANVGAGDDEGVNWQIAA